MSIFMKIFGKKLVVPALFWHFSAKITKKNE